MRTLRHSVFLLCLSLFCLNQVLELVNIYLRPLYTHLDDLLCMPIVLTIALAAERAYFEVPGYVLPARYTVGAVLAFTVVFELLLPLFSPRHTADALDAAAYAVGAVIFHFIINKPLH